MSPVRLSPADANAWVRRVKAAVTPVRELDPDPSPALLAPGLYLGSMAHASNVPLMKRLGLTHVLDCADREPIEAYDAAGVEHLLLGAQDNTSYPLLKTHSAQAAAFLRPALDGGGAVLVHCEQGINRSAAIAIAFLLGGDGATARRRRRRLRRAPHHSAEPGLSPSSSSTPPRSASSRSTPPSPRAAPSGRGTRRPIAPRRSPA